MTYRQLLAFFGGLSKAAQALDTKRQTVHQWGVRRRIPPKWQIRAAIASEGELKPNREAQRAASEFGAYVNRTDAEPLA